MDNCITLRPDIGNSATKRRLTVVLVEAVLVSIMGA
jgi:hypothetical protein